MTVQEPQLRSLSLLLRWHIPSFYAGTLNKIWRMKIPVIFGDCLIIFENTTGIYMLVYCDSDG